MDQTRFLRERVRQLKGKYRDHLTDEELSLFTRKSDSIMLQYDPLFCVCHISIVFTRVQIGTDNGVLDILRSINHNTMVDHLTSHPQLPNHPIQLEVGNLYDYNNTSYYFAMQEGDLVTGYHVDTSDELTVPLASLPKFR